MQSSTRVLVVDDEPALRRGIARTLQARGMEVLTADDGAAAMDILQKERIDIALIDVMMPKVDGMKLLEHIKANHNEVEVIMMTAFGNVEIAVKAVRAGAYHFLTKPFRSNDEMVLTVAKAAERRQLVGRAMMLERKLAQHDAFGGLTGNSPLMREVYRLAMGVAPTSSTVLILGESGTGKELTARAIHQHSPRANKPFIAMNCSAIPVDLVESELFGHVRGAFTGATATREGLFEAANNGTVFLDEVGDLPLLVQVKLLRALQEGEIKRVGSNETRTVNVRVIAATNVDLRTRIVSGRFREDLFYRLNVVAIELPPLRKRREDIPLLAQHFLNKYASRAGRNIKQLAPETMRLLQRRSWPGNVRELENAMEHAVVFCQGEVIEPDDLPSYHAAGGDAPNQPAPPPLAPDSWGETLAELPYKMAKHKALEAFDAAYFAALLQRTQGNMSEAARIAGLDRSNFRRAARRSGADGDGTESD